MLLISFKMVTLMTFLMTKLTESRNNSQDYEQQTLSIVVLFALNDIRNSFAVSQTAYLFFLALMRTSHDRKWLIFCSKVSYTQSSTRIDYCHSWGKNVIVLETQSWWTTKHSNWEVNHCDGLGKLGNMPFSSIIKR